MICIQIFRERARLIPESITEKKYKVTTDWEGKLYIGIALKWDYEKGTVQISMTGYVRAALHDFQHDKPKQMQESPYPWTQPITERTIRFCQKKYQLKNWMNIIRKYFRK